MDDKELLSCSKEELIGKIACLRKRVKVLEHKADGIVKKEFKPRDLDSSRFGRRRIALKVAYLGWDYNGFAMQHGTNLDTVEQRLYAALAKTRLAARYDEATDWPLGFDKCGRTDRGVSALGNVVAVTVRCRATRGLGVVPSTEGTDSARGVAGDEPSGVPGEVDGACRKFDKHSDEQTRSDDATDGVLDKLDRPKDHQEVKEEDDESIDYVALLNRCLPRDIRVVGWAPVPEDFSSRHCCSYRLYKYYFPVGGLRLDLMREAASRFLGFNDFRNFCKRDRDRKITDFRRTILWSSIDPADSGVDPRGPSSVDPPGSSSVDSVGAPSVDPQDPHPAAMYTYTVASLGFLYHQVRCIMSILFLVGREQEPPGIVSDLLDPSKFPDKPNYPMASEIPLVLYDCVFPDTVRWRLSGNNREYLVRNFQQLWTESAVKRSLCEEAVAVVTEGKREAPFLVDHERINRHKLLGLFNARISSDECDEERKADAREKLRELIDKGDTVMVDDLSFISNHLRHESSPSSEPYNPTDTGSSQPNIKFANSGLLIGSHRKYTPFLQRKHPVAAQSRKRKLPVPSETSVSLSSSS